MKKILAVIFILVVATGVSIAQEIDVGAKVGGVLCIPIGEASDYNLPYGINLEKVSGNDPGFDISFGIFGRYYLNDNFHLTAEILYSGHTLDYVHSIRSYSGTSGAGHYHLTYELTKIEIPALIGMQIFESFSVYAGPCFALIMSDAEDIAGSELCINAGAQYTIFQNFIFDFRGSYGLTNLYTGEGIGYLDLMPEYNSLAFTWNIVY